MTPFDEIAIGDRRELGRYTFTAEDIKRFAQRYDPQPFHLDEEAAAGSIYGGLIASGWHTASVFMKLSVEDRVRMTAEMLARGEKPVMSGPSPGFRNLRWIKPVYADDTLTYTMEIVGKRELASRPGWGIVFARNTAVNQNGVLVFEFEGSFFVARRTTSSS